MSEQPTGNRATKQPLTITVNGKAERVEAVPRKLLCDVIREDLRLTGTHVGCDTSQCGACVVHLNGRSVKSCTMLAVQAEGAEVATIEGVAIDGNLHPMQEAFREHHGLQCGYCTPGMLMSSFALLTDNPKPSQKEIRKAIAGNLCRCTGYHNIFIAIDAAANKMQGS